MANKTRAGLEAQIADDLARSDLTMQIGEAVQTAIDAYANDRFWFNEAYRVTATLSISTASIALAAGIGTTTTRFEDIDRVRLLRTSGNFIDMYKRDYDWIMARQDAVVHTQPAEYCVYGEALHFDSFGDKAYTFYIDGIKKLGNAAQDSYSESSSVAWFADARELIRHRAKRELYAHVLKDIELAAASAAAEGDAFNELKDKTNQRITTGFIRPTEF